MQYLIIDPLSRDYLIARRTEEEVRPELVKGMAVGEVRSIPDSHLLIERES